MRKIYGLQILFTVIEDFCIEKGKNSIFKTRHMKGYDRENVSISSHGFTVASAQCVHGHISAQCIVAAFCLNTA